MPLLRRAVPVEPQVLARLDAVLPLPGADGWVPPGDAVARGGSSHAARPAPLPGRRLFAVPGRRGRGRHAAGRAPEGPGEMPAAPVPVVASPVDRLPDLTPSRGAWSWSALAGAGGCGAGADDAGPAADQPEAGATADHAPPAHEPPAHEPPAHEPPAREPPAHEPPPTGGRAAAVGPAEKSVLDRWRIGRIDPGRRGLAALALVAVLAAALAGWVVLRARPQEVAPPAVVSSGVPVPGSSAAAGSRTSSGGATTAPAGEVVVSVGGDVAHPGLLRLPAGSRVDDAVRAAGGALPGADVTTLNLARRLVDGELLLVGVPAPAGADPSGPSSPADGLVDLNTATLSQFDSLPGIGPVLAQKLLDWRTEHGRFGSVDQLREVGGIGESKYAEIKDKVRV